MDCEKFDQHVIDALYDELDELTMASMKRHMESCSRCAAAFSGLRATRDVAVLPLEEPSEELESRILFAASAAQRKTPWHKKALRALAWAGSHAMRPQLAMAAVFVLVIGSSLLLLRAKPGTTSLAPVRVTERGEPSPERDEGDRGPAPPAAAAPTAFASAAPAEVAAQATAESGAARGDAKGEKQAQAEDEAKSKGGDAQAALAEAKSTEASQGCDAALAKYDDVGVRFAGTTQAAEAMFAAAACHKKRGDTNRAREIYGVLAKRDDYKDKAEEALNETPAPMTNSVTAAAASASPAATAPAGGAKAAAAAPAPPAATSTTGSAGKAVAAPAPKAAPAKPSTPSASEQNSQAPGWGGSRPNAAAEKRKVDMAR